MGFVLILLLGSEIILILHGPTPSINDYASKLRTTRLQVNSFSAALTLYYQHNSAYPTTRQGLNALIKKPIEGNIPKNWNGPYIKKFSKAFEEIPKDVWENPYMYVNAENHYEIISFGADGKKGGMEENKDISSKYLK